MGGRKHSGVLVVPFLALIRGIETHALPICPVAGIFFLKGNRCAEVSREPAIMPVWDNH